MNWELAVVLFVPVCNVLAAEFDVYTVVRSQLYLLERKMLSLWQNKTKNTASFFWLGLTITMLRVAYKSLYICSFFVFIGLCTTLYVQYYRYIAYRRTRTVYIYISIYLPICFVCFLVFRRLCCCICLVHQDKENTKGGHKPMLPCLTSR